MSTYCSFSDTKNRPFTCIYIFSIIKFMNIVSEIQNNGHLFLVWTQKCAVQKASVDVNISY